MANQYHEEELVFLTSEQPRSRRQLDELLMRRNYTSCDGYYFLSRSDKTEDWQADEVLTIDLQDENGAEVYQIQQDVKEQDRTWSSLKLSYLLATLPVSQISSFVQECAVLSSQFDLRIEHNSCVCDAVALEASLNSIANELRENHDEPGSNWLRQLIELEYPLRNRDLPGS